MLRKLLKNKRAQNTAEYAILISLVVAGIIAMQTYAQRALQAKVRDASQFLTDTTGALNMDSTPQYEPYYLESSYDVTRDETKTQRLDTDLVSWQMDNNRARLTGGKQTSLYNANKVLLTPEDFL